MIGKVLSSVKIKSDLFLTRDNWAEVFDTAKTRERDFYLKNKVPVKVPMMHMKATMNYLERDDYRVVAKSFRVRIFTVSACE